MVLTSIAGRVVDSMPLQPVSTVGEHAKAAGGSSSGQAVWTEAGALDKRGHNEGWKLARSVDMPASSVRSEYVDQVVRNHNRSPAGEVARRRPGATRLTISAAG
jgi:hypothetical protein